MESRVGEQLNKETEREYFVTLIKEELLRTSDNPEKDLKLIIDRWLSVQDKYHGNSKKGDLVSQVTKCVENDDYLSAIFCFVDQRGKVPLTGSVEKSLKAERSVLRILLTTEESRKVLLKENSSPTFKLGSSAHSLMEKLVLTHGNLELVKDQKVFLKRNEEGEIIGITISDHELKKDENGETKVIAVKTRNSQQSTFIKESRNKTESDVIFSVHEKIKSSLVKNPELNVDFAEPLRPINKGEKEIDWLCSIFTESLSDIANHNGGLPARPSDVEKIFDDVAARSSLIKALEAAHILFGFKNYLSVVDWKDTKSGEINYAKTDMFAVLNWLAIIRKSLELKANQNNNSKSKSLMVEVKEASLKFQIPIENEKESIIIPVHGNKIDVLRLSLEGISNLTNVDESGNIHEWGLRRVVDYIQSQFNSQDLRHRTYRSDKGERKLVSTKLQRNTRSLFSELYKHFGDEIFKHLAIDIDDFKFLGGDGNWAEQYDPEDLPVKSHERQVSGYIFKVLSQLCWLKKKLELNKTNSIGTPQSKGRLIDFTEREDIILTVEEVIDFALESGIINRIKGHLLYELPAKEVICEVVPTASDRNELIKWGIRASKLDSPKTNQRDRLRVVRAISTMLKPFVSSLEIKRKEPKTLPKKLEEICINWRENFYLSIDRLWDKISEKLSSKELKIINAVYFKNDGVRVLWLKNLLENNDSVIRIAIDKKANFSISGFGDDKIVSGKLLSKRDNWGVQEKAEKLLRIYDNNIWGMLRNFESPAPIILDSEINGDRLMMPNGEFRRLIPGKPIICKYNLLTGRWYLDQKLLKVAVGSDAGRSDHLGVHQLANSLNEMLQGRKHRKTVFCPMPTHDNKITEAAILNNDSIVCMSECGHIHLPSMGKIRVNSEFKVLTHTVEDFRSVSKERGQTLSSLMKLGSIFAESDPVPISYIHSRGVEPDDIGIFAYIPLELNIYLGNLIGTEAFKELVKKIEYKDTYYFNGFGNLLKKIDSEDTRVAVANYESALEIIENLPSEKVDDVYRTLNMKLLLEMQRRGVIESKKYRLGGRLILATYWLSSGKNKGGVLAQSNFNGRGIEVGGKTYYNEQPHHKLYIGSRNGKKVAEYPVGFYIRDVDAFFNSVTDTIIVSEGPFNAASLHRMIPNETYNLNITNSNVSSYGELMAFLRWLGVDNDPQIEKSKMGLKIKKVILSLDFDFAGSDKFHKHKERLENEFPGIQVIPIHDILPSDIKKVLPTFNKENYIYPEGHPKEGDKTGLKLDLNDILKKHSDTWASENGINKEVAKEIEKLRLKYAYIPK